MVLWSSTFLFFPLSVGEEKQKSLWSSILPLRGHFIEIRPTELVRGGKKFFLP